MRKILVTGIVLLAVAAVAQAQRSGLSNLAAAMHQPSVPFDMQAPPLAPDYSQISSWAALPDMPTESAAAPPGATTADPKTAPVDVFFIHPTTDFDSNHWNQDLSDAATNKWTDDGPIHSQASVFNGCCRIYAPRYRQVSFGGEALYPKDSDKARALAYSDVKRAFQYYLDHYNRGRPFILASHSQGSRHSTVLIPEMIDGTPLMKRFVVAYTIGAWIPQSWFDTLKQVKPCGRADDTGCVVTWSTLAEGSDAQAQRLNFAMRAGEPNSFADQPFACINPLSWSRGTEPTPASFNLGGWTRAGGAAIRPIDVGLVGARCDNGALFVTEPAASGYKTALLPGGNYHNYDYGLFYMNIRKNAQDRVAAYLAARH